ALELATVGGDLRRAARCITAEERAQARGDVVQAVQALTRAEPERRPAEQRVPDGAGPLVADRVDELGRDPRIVGTERLAERRVGRDGPDQQAGPAPVPA